MSMKYMLLICGTAEDRKGWAAMSEQEMADVDKNVTAWFAAHHASIKHAGRLFGPETATTVRSSGTGHAIVTDGPFAETGEAVGGYAIVEVAGADDALELARAWPIGSVEIRELMET